MATPSSRLPRAELPEAEVPTKLPLKSVRGRAAVDEHAVGAVAGDQVALRRADEDARRRIVAAGRLAADQVPDAPLVTRMPLLALPSSSVPVTSVPMLFMAIWLSVAP